MKKKKVLVCLLSIVVVISAISTAVFADYDGWTSLSGSTQYWGYIRSGRFDASGYNQKYAATQAQVYDSNNNAHYHYSRVLVVNPLFGDVYEDSGRIYGTDTTEAKTDVYVDSVLKSMRPYWGT